MIRNLKVLLIAALALVVLGALGASSASAHKAAKKFLNVEGGNTIITTKTDGASTTTTSHYVFDVPGNGNITCGSNLFEGTVEGVNPASIQLRENVNGAGFSHCTFLGQPAFLELNGCSFTFTPGGTLTIDCPAGKEITFGAAGCVLHIPGGQVFAGAATYENTGGTNPNMEITLSLLTTATTKGVVTGAPCITPGAFTTGQITTGNMLLFGEEDKASPLRKSLTVEF